MDITILILTLNEEMHIKRCIESCMKLNCSILVVDSYSNDNYMSINDLQEWIEKNSYRINKL